MAVWQSPAGHAILSAYPKEHRVSSDHAMIDSGSGFAVETWDGSRVHHHYVSTGWAGESESMPAAGGNATEGEREAARAFGLAEGFVKNVLSAAENAHRITQGSFVNVVRGRKVPKGKYEVTKHAQGNYGPYVNLRDDSGKHFSYVAVSNVEIVPDYAAALASVRSLAELTPIVVKTVTEGGNVGWLVLADFIEEHGYTALAGGAVRAKNFADSLRVLFSGEKPPRLSTYYAECANEFRRPFAGV